MSDEMAEAIKAGDGVLMAEQAMLLRECRSALDDLIKKKPGIEALLCGSTTLGNLRASLYDYRPQGVMRAGCSAKPTALEGMVFLPIKAAREMELRASHGPISPWKCGVIYNDMVQIYQESLLSAGKENNNE